MTAVAATTAGPVATPSGEQHGEPVLEVRNLVQRFKVGRRYLEAVSSVSFDIRAGETLGLVGESGCGKSSTGRAVLQMPRPTAGSVRLAGQELTELSGERLKEARRRMQLIFQDPVSSLNPRRQVREIVGEGLSIVGVPKAEVEAKVEAMLALVGLDVSIIGKRRAHQLSGGQCQRVAIARALVMQPEVLVCDEPVASLDVSIQGQVLNILEDMRQQFGLAMLFISHDLSVVHNICDRIAVMYLGQIVEVGPSVAMTRSPRHHYTRALLDSVAVVDPEAEVDDRLLAGEIPSPLDPPSGCRFRGRCPRAEARCADEPPPLVEIEANRFVACHFPLDDPGGSSPVPVTIGASAPRA
ncbi:ABC transporter ATP-binding protein [Desertimonas flava]|uniref:ABC transporter ATP-binding protein n=1 Tax=Desertimonas flava TaxID=2064846 RepID=UPI000E34B16F|nr:ABC transporter ATP-binding protein [Desertimonas flava]